MSLFFYASGLFFNIKPFLGFLLSLNKKHYFHVKILKDSI